LAEKEQATLTPGRLLPRSGSDSDPAQVIAERDRAIQQFRALIPNPSHVTAGDPAKQKAARPTTAWAGRLTAPMAAEFGQSEDVWQSGISCGGGGSPTPSPTPE